MELCNLLLLDEDEDVALLLNVCSETRLYRPMRHARLNIDTMEADTFRKLFRFDKTDIGRLCSALKLHGQISCGSNLKVQAQEGLLIVLRRLAYPNRLSDLEALFGRSAQALSFICKAVSDAILNVNKNTLSNLRSLQWLTADRLQLYANAITVRGAPLKTCWAFIDGTARAICRPKTHQEEYFSGHKRYHCLKYQSVAAPDGIIVNLHGPYQGRKHDAGILAASGLLDMLQAVHPYVLYGDPAYPLRECLISPYPTTRISPMSMEFNKRMASVRQAVEWAFGKVITEFAFVDFKKNQKLLLQGVSDMYHIAVLLTNCHTCLYGSQTSLYFGVKPPTLEDYLGVQHE